LLGRKCKIGAIFGSLGADIEIPYFVPKSKYIYIYFPDCRIETPPLENIVHRSLTIPLPH
jgi:hypothetical protein